MGTVAGFNKRVAATLVAGAGVMTSAGHGQVVMADTMYLRTAVADTYIDENAPNSTHGSESFLSLYSATGFRKRPLIRFDLTGLEDVTITSADVTLSILIKSTGSGESSVGVHELLAPFSESLSTWSGLAGGSAGALLDSQVVTPSSLNTFVSWALPKSVVQNWINNPSLNYGVILLPIGPAGHEYESREGLNPMFPIAPRISFSGDIIPEPATLGLLLLPGAVLLLTRRV